MALTKKQEKELAGKKKKLLAMSKEPKSEYPKKVMGVLIKTPKEMEQLWKSVKGPRNKLGT